MDSGLITLLVIGVLIIIIFFNSLKIVQEYERGVVFRLGRLVGPKGPGPFFIIPIIDRVVRVDLRTLTLEVPTQETITRDNVSVRVNAVLYFKVNDPVKAVVNVMDFVRATLQIAQTTLRSVLGQAEMDELLGQRDKINENLQRIIDQQTEPWGIKVSTVEVKDVELPQNMQRAMARQAEAEREKRAKIINAEGELQASVKLAQAAKIIGSEKQGIQLRYLQTLSEISIEKNSTIIFPLPMDILSMFSGWPNQERQPEVAPPPPAKVEVLEEPLVVETESPPPLPAIAPVDGQTRPINRKRPNRQGMGNR